MDKKFNQTISYSNLTANELKRTYIILISSLEAYQPEKKHKQKRVV